MAAHIASKDREPLSGLVERVTFHSPETGFCVLRVKVRGNRELVTVLGSAASIQPGEFIQASGRWDKDLTDPTLRCLQLATHVINADPTTRGA